MSQTCRILWVMRSISAVNILICAATCLAIGQLSQVVVALVFLASLVATWSTPKLAAWLWGGTCVLGLVLVGLCLRVA